MTDMVKIEIPERHYLMLAKWASVGRTIDAAVQLLDQFAEQLGKFKELTDHETNRIAEAVDHVIGELTDLKQPLDACSAACTSHRIRDSRRPRLGQERVLICDPTFPTYDILKEPDSRAIKMMRGLVEDVDPEHTLPDNDLINAYVMSWNITLKDEEFLGVEVAERFSRMVRLMLEDMKKQAR